MGDSSLTALLASLGVWREPNDILSESLSYGIFIIQNSGRGMVETMRNRERPERMTKHGVPASLFVVIPRGAR